MSGLKRYGWVALAILSITLMTIGLSRGEFDAVRRQANMLCTACIGLTGE